LIKVTTFSCFGCGAKIVVNRSWFTVHCFLRNIFKLCPVRWCVDFTFIFMTWFADHKNQDNFLNIYSDLMNCERQHEIFLQKAYAVKPRTVICY
jgi:hypothetical protein